MNRLLKFRAWNGECMVSPDYVDRNGIAWWKENSIPTSSDKVMQFTGLHDAKGNEIYEGDIVCIEDCELIIMDSGYGPNGPYERTVDYTGPVYYSGSGFCFLHPNSDTDCPIDIDLDKTEVIGNIYENPELCQTT